MNNFKRISAVVLAGLTLIVASGSSHGLGFGKANSKAILGDTLRVTVPLHLEAGEEMSDECLAADVYFGDDKVPDAAVTATLLGAEGATDRVMKVTTTAAVNEPVVTIYLVAGCLSKITRKYVTFADPPNMVAPNLADASPALSRESVAMASLGGDEPQAAPHSSKSARAASHSRQHAGRAVAKAAADEASETDAPVMSGRAAHVMADASMDAPAGSSSLKSEKRLRTGSRHAAKAQAESAGLVLERADIEAMTVPTLRMSAGMVSVILADDQSPELMARRQAAAAIWLALNATPDQFMKDRQRLQELEQRLAQLKEEGARSKSALASLQARLQQAESQPANNKLLMILGAVALGAIAVAAYMWKKQRQQPKSGTDAWWQSQPEGLQRDEPTSEPLSTPHEPAPPRAADPFVPPLKTEPAPRVTEPMPLSAEAAQAQAKAVATPPSTFQVVPDAPAQTAAMATSAPATFVSRHAEPLREVSVEELIDLEQQAEFFVVLGQDDAAIGLLEGHVQHTTGASPLPFLKLLEIYRRLAKKADYERVQLEFNKRFNAYAPSWESDLQHGHSLADYPGVIERLQALWAEPSKAMEVLEKSLTRPDSSADTFELPAYRELLFLYAVARDLSERDVSPAKSGVDLLLPVVDMGGAVSAAAEQALPSGGGSNVIEPLMATRPIKAQPDVLPSFDLDLHLDDIAEPAEAHKP